MNIVDERIEQYAVDHSTRPGDPFDRLERETYETQPVPQMMMNGLASTFIGFLVSLMRASTALEIGTFTGASSIAIARALRPGGTLVSCDVNEETTAIARRYAEEAGVAGRIDFRLGPALETIASLEGPFDVVFVDADKVSYPAYFEAVLSKLADGGLILVDNTLSDGDVLAPNGPSSAAIAAFNDDLRDDPRVDCVLLTVRDGITLIRKR